MFFSVFIFVGCMFVVVGFINVILVLEFLFSLEEKGLFLLSVKSFIVWFIGFCFFGFLFVVVFCNYFVV